MAGSAFQTGESKIRPGVYVRTTNIGLPATVGVPLGTVAVLFKSTWGPLASLLTLEPYDMAESSYGTGATMAALQEAFKGGAKRVLAFRLGGAGAVKAAITLKDTTGAPIDAVTITARYEGSRGAAFKAQIRDSLTDALKRELLIYEDTTLRQIVSFTKGALGVGEPQALAAAVLASGSPWITAANIADGTKLLAVLASTTFTTAGVDPTVDGTSYTAGMTALEAPAVSWDVLATDSVDTAIQATLAVYIDRIRGDGRRGMLALGEPTAVALATRQANAAAFNHPAIVYAGNGFADTSGVVIEGYLAACRLAGLIAGQPVTSSVTNLVVQGGASVVGPLTNADIEVSLQNGMIVFTTNSKGQVRVEQGITTLVSLSADQDAGWKKIRRTRTRDNLVARIVAQWDEQVGRVANSDTGRALMIATAQGVVTSMIAEGAIAAGTIGLDAGNPPAGDSAWFIATVDDLDSMEHVYLTFQFRYSPPVA